MFALSIAATLAASVPDQIAAVSAFRAKRIAKDAPAVPVSAYETAASGKVATGVTYEEGVAAGKGWAVAVSDVPIEALWMAMNAEDQYVGRFDGLTASVVLSGSPHGSPRVLFQSIDLPVVSDRWWVSLEQFNGALYTASAGQVWECAWTDATDPARLSGTAWADVAASGVPVAWSKGAWLLVPLEDGRTVIEYFVWTDPGGRLPAAAATRFAAGALDRTVRDLESLARDLAAGPRTGFVRPDGRPLE
jgi:hypothetical protein